MKNCVDYKEDPPFRLKNMLAQNGWTISLSCFFGTLSALFAFGPYLLIYYFAIQLLDETLTMSSLLSIAAGLFLSVIGRNILFSLSTYISHIMAFRVLKELRLTIFQHLGQVEIGYFFKKHSSDIRKTILDDVEILEDSIAHTIPELTSIMIGPIVLILIMSVIDWHLTLACLLPLCFAVILMGLISQRMKLPTKHYFSASARLNGAVSEVVRAMPLIKTFNVSETAEKKLNQACDHYFTQVRAWIDATLWPSNLFFILSVSSPLFALAAGSLFYANQWVTRDVFLLFLCLSIGLSNLFVLLMELLQRLEKQKEALRRIKTIMNEPVMQEARSSHQLNNHSIKFENVSFAYENELVLKNINLTFQPGQTIGLVGRSGAGKTTLLRCLLNFYDLSRAPSGGRITIGGVNINELPGEQLYGLMAYVFQDTFLFRGSIAENLRLAQPKASQSEIEQACKKAGAHAFITQLPLAYDTQLGENGTSLSGGERQRLAIARAFLKDAPILILDEATSQVDVATKPLVQQTLSRLAQNRTVFIISHNIEALQHCDQIIVMDQGEVAAVAPHKDLLTSNSIYQSLWQAQKTIEEFCFQDHSTKGSKQIAAEVAIANEGSL